MPPTILALLSDSHDDLPALRAALALLAPHHPTHYLHLGDLCHPRVLSLLIALAPTPVHFVFGNNDFDHDALRAAALASPNLTCHDYFADLTLDSHRLALLHGDDAPLKRQLLASQSYHYLFHGHTHKPADTRHGTTRLINPGALHRANPKSCALLNLATDTLQFLTLP